MNDDDRAIAEALSDRDARIAELEAKQEQLCSQIGQMATAIADGFSDIKAERDAALAKAERLQLAMSRCLLGEPPSDCYAAEVVDLRAERAELNAHLESLQNRFAQATGEVERLREDRNNLLNAMHQIEQGDYEMGEAENIAANAINVHAKRAALGDG